MSAKSFLGEVWPGQGPGDHGGQGIDARALRGGSRHTSSSTSSTNSQSSAEAAASGAPGQPRKTGLAS